MTSAQCNHWNRDLPPLRYSLMGDGRSLVVLDSGLQDSQRTWSAVAAQVATFARVLLLDRAELPAPESSPGDVRPGGIVEPVIGLIDQHVAQGNVVLAGWALGAIWVQALAIRRPEWLTGLVLVDPLPVELVSASGQEQAPGYPLIQRSGHRAFEDLERINKRIGMAGSGLDGDLEVPDLPVTIILPGIQPDSSDQAECLLRELQRRDLLRFTRAREVIAGRSRYDVPTERPDVIVDAIHHHVLPSR